MTLSSAGCSSKPGTASRVFQMGERAEVGTMVYNVLQTEWKTELGEGIAAKHPAQRYLIVDLTVTNGGGGESSIPPMVLVDPKGQTYQEVMIGDALPKWLGMLRKIGPAQTEQGQVVFDAPPGSYSLQVSDDAEPGEERTALISLPLQVAPELPSSLKDQPLGR